MKYIELGEIITLKGAGLPDVTAELIKRNDKVAMYLRSDGYYEIGLRKFVEAGIVPSGSYYPAREIRWSNEDFGIIASTTKSEIRAFQLFDYFNRATIPLS